MINKLSKRINNLPILIYLLLLVICLNSFGKVKMEKKLKKSRDKLIIKIVSKIVG